MVWTESGWAILILIVSLCLYSVMIIKNKDPSIGLTAIWVYIAIADK